MKIKLFAIAICMIVVFIIYVVYSLQDIPENKSVHSNNHIENQKYNKASASNKSEQLKEIKVDKFLPNPNWKDKMIVFLM